MNRVIVLTIGILIALLFFASFASEPSGSQKPNGPSGAEAWKLGVIVIDHQTRQATGMYVDTHWVLTAAHISKAWVWKFYGCYPYWGWSPETGIIKLTPLMIDIKADLLLLRADKPGRHVFRRMEAARVHEAAYVVGYQYGWFSCEVAQVATHINTGLGGLDQRIAPLGSGSPVLNKSGAVIGMVAATDEYFTYFVPAGDISTFIERYRTEQKDAEKKQEWD